jgi:photosystem II stability/assembly factor-like uncharacterized protein
MTTPRLCTLAALGAAFALVHVGCQQFDFTPRYDADEIGIYDDLFSVSVADERHAVAAGYHGAVYWTQDGGETWQKGQVPTKRGLYSVSMADAKHGWAVGQSGTILRTGDGGANWTQQPNLKTEEDTHLNAVHAIDADTAWVVGQWGTRILTRDGGLSWTDHSLTIDIAHPQFVWLSEEDQKKVRRGDKVYEDVGLTHVFCLDPPSQKCWHTGEFGYIYYSDELGGQWKRAEIVGEIHIEPIPFAYNGIEIGEQEALRIREFARAISDETHLNVLIDPFVSPREIARFGNPEDPFELFDIIAARIAEARSLLEDAGILTDRLRMPNKPPWDYEDFQEDDPTFLGRYLETRTSEQPMLRIAVIQNPYLFNVKFRDEAFGLISGLGGVILRSDDGGHTWTYQETDRKQAFYSVAANSGLAIAVGEKGLVRLSRDDGSSWTSPSARQFPEIFTFMRDLGFESSARVGFIVGQEGRVLRSTDGGENWRQVLPRS